MIYKGSNKIEADRARGRLEKLIDDGKIFELTDKSIRSLNANSYFHLLCAYYGFSNGYTTEEAKTFVKAKICPDIYAYEKDGVTHYRSITIVSAEDFTLTISMFKEYSAKITGLKLPDSEDKDFLEWIRAEESKYKKYQVNKSF